MNKSGDSVSRGSMPGATGEVFDEILPQGYTVVDDGRKRRAKARAHRKHIRMLGVGEPEKDKFMLLVTTFAVVIAAILCVFFLVAASKSGIF
jgi:hypothetical protein